MVDSGPEGAPSGSQRNGDDQLAELRALLVGPESRQLRRLQERLDNLSVGAEDVSGVLAEAISLRAAQDSKLRTVLQPLLEEGLKISVQRNPQTFSDILFPVLGPAIRKAVSAAIQSMLEGLNQTMEQSFSLRGLQWRIEAWRTGRSFPEVVVARSALYRVEQVFLIHRETSLLLEHRVAAAEVVKDPALVSAMLTAIHDFVGDSFGAPGGDQLETMRVGDYVLWVQHGPRALLASVVRGVAPAHLRSVFENAIERIHQELGAELAAFQGDATPFEAARPYLDACLLGRMEKPRKLSYWPLAAGAAAVLILIAAVGLSLVRERRKWSDLVERLGAEPGIVVTHSGPKSGSYSIYGLRDPLSAPPERIVESAGIDPKRVEFHWEPYESGHPNFAALRGFERQKERVEACSVYFRSGSSEVSLDSVGFIGSEIHSLLRYAQAAKRPVSVQVLGYTDHQGTLAMNETLARNRAAQVRAELIRQGIDAGLLEARGAGLASESDSALERRAVFRVTVRQ